ncbi:hypothetical protein SLS56_003266 [Neofusicoccum ribis]|uniref:Transcription factor domain-containing protein n=1 Tax=Neofusicoccum ribis TaxID=45134 RepID=A0ABR3T076_9PEZI
MGLGSNDAGDDPRPLAPSLSPFDTASLAILDRVNYAVSLLEAQSSQPTPQPAVVPQTPVDESAHEVELLEQSVAAATSAAHLLDWPIFEHKHGREALDAAVLSHSAGIPADYPGAGTDLDEPAEMSDIQSAQRSSKPGRGIHEEDVPALVQAFLENVHIKNPVLDSTDLKRWARAVREHGFGWSSRSCLLLVACALGALSSPFKPTLVLTSVSSTTSDSIQEAKDYTTAERYYNASRKRIGLLGNSLIAAQCMFLSGVYEMYSLRPLQAWTSFSRAGDIIQIYRMVKPDPTTPKFPSVISLEHRLYWSCLKSISEIREQLPLPPSGLASLDYPLFPTLPITACETDSVGCPADSIFEKSWFYYLAEISSRRIANRILNAFYKTGQTAWLSSKLDGMVRIAHELETQVDQWFQHIPEPLKWHEMEIPPEELAFMVRAREVHMYMFIYRPFLFIAVHRPEALHDPRVQLLAEKGLRGCVQLSSTATNKHRHHGTYFAGRSLFSAALSILAAVKCGKVSLPPGWRDSLQSILAFLKYWETEAPDLGRARAIIQEIWKEVSDMFA